jgi:hypothetical protein
MGLQVGAESGEPIGAVVVETLARVPRIKDRIDISPEVNAEVIGMARRRITRLRVRKNDPPHIPEPPKSRRPPAA